MLEKEKNLLTKLMLFMQVAEETVRRWPSLHSSFLCVLLSPEVTCEQAWSLCYVGSMNVELEGQKCNKGLREVNKINASCHC